MRLKFKVTLKRVERPKVWREITVPEDYTFDQLHTAIQLAFGWTNSHMYQFSDVEIYDKTNPYNESFYITLPEFQSDDIEEEEFYDSTQEHVSSWLTKKGDKISYVYDMGDHWVHDVEFLGMEDTNVRGAHCVAGEGACPPEDCGGTYGFAELKKICRNAGKSKAARAEWQEYLEWMGYKSWHPEAFNVKSADRDLMPTRRMIYCKEDDEI